MVFVWQNALVGFPKVAVTETLFVVFRDTLPKLLARGCAASTDDTGNDLTGLFT